MMENDPLKQVLQEWRAPEPGASLNQRVRAAYRESYRPSPWKQFWMTRISVPAPALAVVAILIVALVLQFVPLRRRSRREPIGGMKPGWKRPVSNRYPTAPRAS